MAGGGGYEAVPRYDEGDGREDSGYPRTVKNKNGGQFSTNYVSTTKYNRFTFLPLAILEQYKKLANVYLLVIAVLCCIPAISPLMPIAAVMPVVFVLSISLIREGMEDYARYKNDEELNNKLCNVRGHGAANFTPVKWKEVNVGDLVKIEDRDWIPSDVLLLTSSGEGGAAFIDTMDLDGETNLKRRSSPKLSANVDITNSTALEALSDCVLKCVAPSGDLYSFDGAMQMGNGQSCAVSEQNLLLRSSRLRNTKWAVGIVIYTGEESKVMLNSRSSSNKQSHVEGSVNNFIIAIFFIQLVMAILSAILAGSWASTQCPRHEYLHCSSAGAQVGSLTFWTYIILLNSLIPASLIVTMEIVKVAHASFISWDIALVHGYDKKEKKWKCAEAHTSTLNEGLGQIDFIFSDKTGTLTENKMELRYVTVDGDAYTAESGQFLETTMLNDTKLRLDKGFKASFQEIAQTEGSSGWQFLRMLAVCQTVMLEKGEDNEISYNADSPDEVALVVGGSQFGCAFTGREGDDMTLLEYTAPIGNTTGPTRSKEQWRVLDEVPFSSKRKRMTVIVQRIFPPPKSTSKVSVWMKGADNVILDRIVKGDPLLDRYNKHLLHYSMDGLRTLCFATKEWDAKLHKAWAQQWEAAKLLPPAEREAKFDKLAADVEDEGFKLVGCTAVEDKLQDMVPETIVRLARAKIKLWVLTGDKQETAVEIGRSTNLITPGMKLHVLNCESEYDLNMVLDRCLADAIFGAERGGKATTGPKQALVIDGGTLNFVIEGNLHGALICKPAADKFVALATQCESVVICRSSPLQKALVVLLIKKYIPGVRSLSVGDGANDVPMIRAAAIGVGIAGMEGMQAARASDYSIQMFKDLDRLLLHHGRLSYFRIANMCTYFFYKSWTFTLPQWLFGFYCGYSGQTFYEALYVPSFNMFFTSMPVFIRACLDQDLDIRKAGPLLPELYHVSKEDVLLNPRVLTIDLLLSFIHAYLCFFVPQYAFSLDDSDMWQMSLATYSLVIFTVTVRIAVHTRHYNAFTAFAYTTSIAVYYAWQYTYDAYGSKTIRGAAPALNRDNAKFSYMVWLFIGATLASEVFMRWCTDNMNPSNVDIVRAAKEEEIIEKGKEKSEEATAAQLSSKGTNEE